MVCRSALLLVVAYALGYVAMAAPSPVAAGDSHTLATTAREAESKWACLDFSKAGVDGCNDVACLIVGQCADQRQACASGTSCYRIAAVNCP